MGWDYHTRPITQEAFFAERTANEDFEWEGQRIRRRCLVMYHDRQDNVLWTVWEVERGTAPAYRYIGCDVLKGQGKCCWGYKDLSEEMHPYYYGCPLLFLALVPVACQLWRNCVMAHYVDRAATVAA